MKIVIKSPLRRVISHICYTTDDLRRYIGYIIGCLIRPELRLQA